MVASVPSSSGLGVNVVADDLDAGTVAGHVQDVAVPEPHPLGRVASRDGISTGRSPVSNESFATRAERFADLTELNVAIASTSVPPAVASEETVTQSVIRAVRAAAAAAGRA